MSQTPPQGEPPDDQAARPEGPGYPWAPSPQQQAPQEHGAQEHGPEQQGPQQQAPQQQGGHHGGTYPGGPYQGGPYQGGPYQGGPYQYQNGPYQGGYVGVPVAPPSPEEASARSRAITSLVLNIVTVMFCLNVIGIVGAVLAGVALGRVGTDLASARNLVRWSWIALAGGLVLNLVLAVLAVSLLMVSATY